MLHSGRRARLHAHHCRVAAFGPHASQLLASDRSSAIGFRFFTLRLLLNQHHWSGQLFASVSVAAAPVGGDLEECQRVVDEHMKEEKRRKDAMAEAIDWDSGFSDG